MRKDRLCLTDICSAINAIQEFVDEMRVVLDIRVSISVRISARGAPDTTYRAWTSEKIES
jgi:hypothetical protein